MRAREITAQIIDHSRHRVVQAVEPEAARLLIEYGGQITRYELNGMYYWDYQSWEEQWVLSWPAETIIKYVSARGQEDTAVVFAVILLPACTQELHMVYDYRLRWPADPLEEYFTLRAA